MSGRFLFESYSGIIGIYIRFYQNHSYHIGASSQLLLKINAFSKNKINKILTIANKSKIPLAC